MPESTHLHSVDEVIERLGGSAAVREMTGVRSPQAVWSWRKSGTISSKFYLMMTEALGALGCTADPELWGQKAASGPQPGTDDAARLTA